MALHLEFVFSPLCMCSIAVPKIDMVTNTKLVELGILKPGNTQFLNNNHHRGNVGSYACCAMPLFDKMLGLFPCVHLQSP